MRKIKFRGYRESTKSWVYGVFAPRDAVLQQDTFHMSKFWELVEEGVLKYVGQFTGLKDKNGKEIYEGDVVKFSDYPISEIYYCVNHYRFECGDFDLAEVEDTEDIEVIGNIYENPELLEVTP